MVKTKFKMYAPTTIFFFFIYFISKKEILILNLHIKFSGDFLSVPCVAFDKWPLLKPFIVLKHDGKLYDRK